MPVIHLFSVGVKLGSFALREGHMLRVLENGVLRGISGPKSEEVAGDC